jgi:hypothetical protein
MTSSGNGGFLPYGFSGVSISVSPLRLLGEGGIRVVDEVFRVVVAVRWMSPGICECDQFSSKVFPWSLVTAGLFSCKLPERVVNVSDRMSVASLPVLVLVLVKVVLLVVVVRAVEFS